MEQRVDHLWTLQHHHVAAFINELQESQEQDLQEMRAKAGDGRAVAALGLPCSLPFIPQLPPKGELKDGLFCVMFPTPASEA